MKILMLTDTHFLFKRNGRVKDIQMQQLDYVSNYIKENGIDYLFMMGDFMDESVKDNIGELNDQWDFVAKLYEMRNFVKKLIILTGNHDHYSLENHSLVFFKVIQDEKIIFADEIKPIKLEDDFTFLPVSYSAILKISQESKSHNNRNETREEIYKRASKKLNNIINNVCANNHKNMYLFGHLGTLEILPMALTNEPFFYTETLKKFKRSFLGHIHEIKTNDNIHFIGSFGRIAINENRGHFTVFDTNKDTIEYINNSPEIEFLRVKLNTKSDLDYYKDKDLSNSLIYLEEGYDLYDFKDEVKKFLTDAGAIEIRSVKKEIDKKELKLDYQIDGIDGIGNDFINASFSKLAKQHSEENYYDSKDFVYKKLMNIFNEALYNISSKTNSLE